jgi:DNA-binding IclR family transcriptional regulator
MQGACPGSEAEDPASAGARESAHPSRRVRAALPVEYSSTMASDKRIQSVGNAARLLVELAAAPRPMRLNDLSQKLGMNKSSVHLLLATLADSGFIEQTEQATYRLGLALFEVGTAALQQFGLGARLSPPLELLAEATREAVSLSVLHRGEVLLVQRFESDQILRSSIRVGTRMPLARSASGRVVLAFLPEADRRSKLERAGLSAADVRRVASRVQEIRDSGYEVQRDEWSPGSASIAVPVFGAGDIVVAALSVTTPTTRFTPERWVEPLLKTADQLTLLLRQMAIGTSQLSVMINR